MKTICPDVFRTYDVRGIVDLDFDSEWVKRFGQACGTYFLRHGFPCVVVGHDARQSSPEYYSRLITGLASTGVDVVGLGLVSTPMCYFACKYWNTKAGIMVTASHNPPNFNGFKVVAGHSTIYGEAIQEIYRIMASADFPNGKGKVTRRDIMSDYLSALTSSTRLSRPYTVVVDGGNGTGGEVTAKVLERIGARVIRLYCDPDGTFPNHFPDPVEEKNMADLEKKVVATGADCGFGIDGDGDRLGVVDETGKLLFGDQLLAIYARDVLVAHPGATIIGEVKCSHLTYRDITAHGGHPVMAPTGHSLIKDRMWTTGALLAGEMSGHMFFADRYFGFDDATYAALRFLEVLDGHPATSAHDLLADWPATFNTPEIRRPCPDHLKNAVVAKLKEGFAGDYKIIDIDGIRIVLPDGWGLVRASNTQPALVLRFEAGSRARLAEMRSVVETKLDQVLSSLGA